MPDLFLDDHDTVETHDRPAPYRSRFAGLVVLVLLVVLMAAALVGAFVFSGDADRGPDPAPPAAEDSDPRY